MTPDILIAICSFRRPGLIQTLQSVQALDLTGLQVAVAVADNDDVPSAAGVVAQGQTLGPLVIKHLHAPARNISVARNALLEYAQENHIRLIIYLDDDQIVPPDWLVKLIAGWRREQDGPGPAGVVLGPVRGVYDSDAPAWMARAGAHDNMPVTRRDGVITAGYTGNSLFDLADPALSGLRFDLSRGRSGGEDTAFLSQFLAAGGRIAFVPDAAITEPVPAGRARLGWLLQRRYRMGQTHASLIAAGRSRAGRIRAAALAGAKMTACMGMAMAGILRPEHRNRQMMRTALHAGAVAHLLGARSVEIYSSLQSSPDDDPGRPKEV